MSIAPVIRAVIVDTPAERAFAVFTQRIGDWWPLATHTPAESLAAGLAFVDGSLVESSPDGVATVWGTVTEWDPPRRLALTWSPGGGPVTAVTVDFEPSDGRTRVVLTHVGWEAYGDKALEVQRSYGGDHAWGWILDLFVLAGGGSDEGAGEPGSHQAALPEAAYDVVPLRGAFEAVAVALEAGDFAEPKAGEWNARQVAGHVATNAELMSRVIDEIRAGGSPRLHGPEDHAPAAVGRFDGLSYDALAGKLRLASAELIARCAGLTGDELATPVATYIEHHGEAIVDGEMTLDELLGAEVHYHLPAHVGQITDLMAAAA